MNPNYLQNLNTKRLVRFLRDKRVWFRRELQEKIWWKLQECITINGAILTVLKIALILRKMMLLIIYLKLASIPSVIVKQNTLKTIHLNCNNLPNPFNNKYLLRSPHFKIVTHIAPQNAWLFRILTFHKKLFKSACPLDAIASLRKSTFPFAAMHASLIAT